jgi:Cu/Ag efflux protein CusF
MKLKNFFVWMFVLGLMLGVGGVVNSDDRPHEGKVISIDLTGMVLTVQGDKDDTLSLYWTETTKLKGDVTVQELKVGDKIHFEFVDKDGKKWLTELKRTDKAKG